MPPLPILEVRQLLRILDAHGFVVVAGRGRGSHRFLQHPDGRTTLVSGNPGDDVRRGRLAKILRDTDLTVDDLD